MWVDANQWGRLTGGRYALRGAHWNSSEQAISIASPSSRTPVHMPPEAHHQIDAYFERRFGVRFRSRSLFATGSFERAAGYGYVRSLVPAASFCFCWSPQAVDLFEEVLHKTPEESYEDLLNRLGYQCDDLYGAIESGNEIMLVGAAFNAFVHPFPNASS